MTVSKYSDIKDKEGVSDTCGICIDEFANADETNLNHWVAETPQCKHHFHKECLMQWCKTKVKKLDKPDCPSCRVLFEPEKRTEERKQEGDPEPVALEEVQE